MSARNVFVSVALSLVCVCGIISGQESNQSLADLARKERERQPKSGKQPAKVYTLEGRPQKNEPDTEQEVRQRANGGVLMSLSLRAATKEPDAVPASQDLARRCADATERAGSYASVIVFDDVDRPELAATSYAVMVWLAEYAEPDRYLAYQQMWDDSRGSYVFDEWIDIGTDHYDNMSVWLQSTGGNPIEESRRKLNDTFRPGKFLAIMRSQAPESAGLYRVGEKRYFVLVYRSPSLSGFGSLADLFSEPIAMRVWIDRETGLLVRGEVVGKSKPRKGRQERVGLVQCFSSYDKPIQIPPPQAQMVPAQPKK